MATIVVQETDQDILEVLIVALELEGFTVYSQKNEDESVLNLIDEVRPHVVVLDYRLDGKLSIEMCRHIKAKYKHLPVIALSCNNNINEEYNIYGFDDYIKKPFDLSLLYKILRKHIPKQESMNNALA